MALGAVKQLVERDLLRDLIPVRAYASAPEDQFFLMDDGGLGFGFLCQPLTGADMTASDRLNVLLTQDWPKGAIMQVGLWAGPDTKATTHEMMDLRGISPEDDDLTPAQETIRSRREFIDSHTEDPIIPSTSTRVREIELFITIALPGDGSEIPGDALIERAYELRKSLNQTLKTAGMAPVTLDAKRYLRVIQTMLNPSGEATWRDTHIPEWEENAEIKDQVMEFDHRLHVDHSGINIDAGAEGARKRVTTMSIKRMPKRISFGAALRYLGDPIKGARGIRDTMLITATLVFLDADKMIGRMESQKQRAIGPSAC